MLKQFRVNNSVHTAFHGGQSQSVQVEVQEAEFDGGTCTVSGYGRIKTVHGDWSLRWFNAGDSFKPDSVSLIVGLAPGEANAIC